jgi:hypothetical protein
MSSEAGPPPVSDSVYHIELRQFPHNLCHFNMTAEQLDAAVVEPWARDQWIEMGERKWSPHQAKLTVLESPYIPVEDLSMGRGWRAAQRRGRDVTERVLAAARERMAGDRTPPPPAGGATAGEGDYVDRAPAGRPGGSEFRGVAPEPPPGRHGGVPETGNGPETPGADLLADSLGLELLGALGADGAPLHRAWTLAAARHPDWAVSDCLALAERAIGSLLRSGLVVLQAGGGEGKAHRRLEEGEARAVLLAVESWSEDSPDGVTLRRA